MNKIEKLKNVLVEVNEQSNKSMSVKEVANVMGVSEKTIQREVVKFFPNIVKNGVKTMLNEQQVTVISKDLKGHHNLDSTVELPTTELEILGNAMKAMKDLQKLYNQKEAEYKATIYEQKHTLELLAHTDKNYDVSEVASELGISAMKLNKILQDKKIQYKVNGTWIPTCKYKDKEYFITKQKTLESGKVVYYSKITQKGREFILNLFTKNT